MIKEIEVGGVKHGVTLADDAVGQGIKKDENGAISVDVNDLGVLTEEKLLSGDTLKKDPVSGNIEVITGTAVIESNTPFVPFAKGKGKKLGVALHDGFWNELGTLGLKVGTISESDNFVPLCLGSCSGLHGLGRYFGISLGSGLKCNRYKALEVSLSSKSAMDKAEDGLSIKVSTEFDISEISNSLHIRLGKGVNEKTRFGFGLCVDRKEGLALSLVPGTNPLMVNEKGELYINIQILKDLLNE